MTLATRCTACGTTFKVVQDQLKVSGGWVRCGRCSEVFNAIDGLFEFRSVGAPEPAPLRAATVEAMDAERTAEAAPASEAAVAVAAESAAAPVQAQAAAEDLLVAVPPPTVQMPAVPTPLPVAAEMAPGAVATLASFGAPAAMSAESGSAVVAELAFAEAATSTAARSAERAPGFVRKADRAARWRRPGVRRALAAAALALCAAMALQVALAYRDIAAARWPATQPLLAQACAWTGCQVEPLRRIGALSVEASGLHQFPGTQVYRLTVVLRNRSDLELMMPSFDLTLTDARGDVVLRRALTAAELGSSARTIRPGAELALEASLDPSDRAVSGYTIEAFYP
jgi:predicted Zn finger-like uncharacterized protein